MKRLFWKECYENRLTPVWVALLLALSMVALCTMGGVDARSSSTELYTSWMVAALFLGAGLISREVGNETLQFLLAMPLSRRRIWWTKVAAGLGLLLISILLTSLVWAGMQHLLYGTQFFLTEQMHWGNGSAFGPGVRHSLQYAGLMIPAAVLVFSISLLVSTLLGRSISAASVALVVGVGLLIPESAFSAVYRLAGVDMTRSVVLLLLVCLPAFAAASYWAFTRGESLRTRRRFGYAAAGLLLGLVLAWTPAVMVYSWVTQFREFGSQVREARISPDGKLVVFRALHGVFWGHSLYQNETLRRTELPPLGDHLVIQDLHGSFRRVIPGGDLVGWAPDGRSLLYRKAVGPLGLSLEQQPYTLLNVRTGQSRDLVDNFNLSYSSLFNPGVTNAWSPDGHWLVGHTQYGGANWPGRVAFYDVRGLETTARLRGDGPMKPRFVDELGDSERGADVLGWSPDSHYLYVVAGARLMAVDTSVIQKRNPGVGLDRTAWRHARVILCTLDHTLRRDEFPSLEIWPSKNRSRTLLCLTRSISSARSSHTEYQNYIVDLEAGVKAARKRPSGERPPSLDAWERACSTVAIPQPYSRRWTRISPDGRYLLTRLESPTLWQWSKYGARTPVLPKKTNPVIALDLDNLNAAPRTLPLHGMPGDEEWFPDGHRFCDFLGKGRVRIIDLSSNYDRVLRLTPNQSPVGAASDSQILVQTEDTPTGVDRTDVFKRLRLVSGGPSNVKRQR